MVPRAETWNKNPDEGTSSSFPEAQQALSFSAQSRRGFRHLRAQSARVPRRIRRARRTSNVASLDRIGLTPIGGVARTAMNAPDKSKNRTRLLARTQHQGRPRLLQTAVNEQAPA